MFEKQDQKNTIIKEQERKIYNKSVEIGSKV